MENWFGLTSETHLLGIIPTLALSEIGCLSSLVLRHLMQGMLLAFSCAVSLALLRNIHHLALDWSRVGR